MELLIAIAAASGAWFVAAAILFFNPPVDKIYGSEEQHPAVRTLPKSGKTIAQILLAVVVQTALWALVYQWVESALPSDTLMRGLMFGGILSLTKIIPRDVDRVLLTTYPPKRMTIEFIVGIVCALVVGVVFAYLM